MTRGNLTRKEQQVLYGIVKFPYLNDRELAVEMDINASTVATIRNKLKNSDYFNIIKIPVIRNLNYQSLIVSYDKMSYMVPTTSPFKIIENISNRIMNYFYMLSITDAWLGIAFAKDIAEAQSIRDTIGQIKYAHNLSIKTINHVVFPFKLSKLYNFFDYSYLLAQIYDIAIEPQEPSITQEMLLSYGTDADPGASEMDELEPDKIDSKFTPIEKQVFMLLTQNPDLSDHAIAKNTSLSSSTVNTINKRLTKKGLIKKLIIPDLEKLGFELMVCTHLNFIPSSTVTNRAKIAEYIKTNISNIFFISNNTNDIIFTVHKNFSDYQKIHEEIINLYQETDMLMEDPSSIILPINEINGLRYHYYQLLLKTILGIKTGLSTRILEVMKEHFGPDGKKILNNQLKRMGLTMDLIAPSDLPRIAEDLYEVALPIFGEKRSKQILKLIEKLGEQG